MRKIPLFEKISHPMSRIIDVIMQAERIRLQFLETVTSELARHGIHDLNNVQAVMLYRIGPGEMHVGDLTLAGCYVGTNVCYNVKKLTTAGYLACRRPESDRRVSLVRVAEKGAKVQDLVAALVERHEGMINSEEIGKVMAALRRMEVGLADHRSWRTA